MFRFNSSRLQIKKELGKGRFGKVFPYQKDPEDVKWVVKRIKATDSDELVACLPEIVLGFACDHPCIVPVKGYYIEKSSDGEGYNIYMKLPRMKETLLTDFKARKANNTPYSEQEIVRHFYSLVCGIEYLHSKKIYHGDIKPDNLLLDEHKDLKVADVGMAKHVEEEDSYQTLAGSVGTYQYSAPEILGKKTTKEMLSKADIWSLGAVILELCVFDFRLLNAILPRDELQKTLNELFASLQGKFHPSLIALVQKLLNLNSKERPDIGQIKTELQNNFSQILDQKLLTLGNINSIQIDNGPEITALNRQIKEISEKYEYEAKHLKENILHLEQQLVQQKQQHEDRIKVLVGQSNSKAREEPSKEKSENLILQTKIKGLEQELNQIKAERQGHIQKITNTNENLRRLEEQIQMLERDKSSSEQKSKDLQRYLETSINDQMKAYEDQIKALKESQLKEKTQFDQEKKKLLENLDTLRFKLEDGITVKIDAKKESFGEDYEKNLKKVVLKLRENWDDVFIFEEEDGKLKITRNEIGRSHNVITDHTVSRLSKDLIEVLGENYLFNLFGLEIHINGCHQLTDKALEYVATALSNQALHPQHLTLDFFLCNQLTNKALEYVKTALSNQALHLQHLTLNFSLCEQLTDKALEYVATALSNQALHLQHLTLNFSRCHQLTDKALEYVAGALSNQALHLQRLNLNFSDNEETGDIGVEEIAKTIQNSCHNLQDLCLNFGRYYRAPNKVTKEKRESLRERFAHIPKLEIS
jgi:serine/threonine protein kinase